MILDGFQRMPLFLSDPSPTNSKLSILRASNDKKILISAMANGAPKHLRAPAPNAKKSSIGFVSASSQRSGTKLSSGSRDVLDFIFGSSS
mmetsp:Transcript_10944/g.23259  ORF Transcript_10944/g.23259 Transcript_10944/m.23259 type:complete len:90 (-) Transcript_10944:790-1059(-)